MIRVYRWLNVCFYLVLFSSLCSPLSDEARQFCGLNSTRMAPSPLESLKQLSHLTLTFLQGRIVGGSESFPQAWPWIVSIHEYSWKTGRFKHNCGATLIDDRWAVTAAHCVYRKNPNFLRLHLGRTPFQPFGKRIVKPLKLIVHPSYAHGYFINDIALILLSERVQFDDEILPICLPDWTSIDHTGEFATAIGWGLEGENTTYFPQSLREVDIPIITNFECSHRLQASRFHPSWLCAGYPQGKKDACQGDSGGPLMLKEDDRWSLIGIISAGPGCARPSRPGIYARITNFLPWIDEQIEGQKVQSLNSR